MDWETFTLGERRPWHERRRRRMRRARSDTSLHRIVTGLVAARHRARLTQRTVAERMRTTASAVSRLGNGADHRPMLTTLESYALVVGCVLEVTLREGR